MVWQTPTALRSALIRFRCPACRLRHQASEATYARTFICSGCGKRLFVAAVSRDQVRLTLTRLRTILTGWGFLFASLVLDVGLAHLGYTAMTGGEQLGVGANLALVGLMAMVGLFLLNLLAEQMGEGEGGRDRPSGAATSSTLPT